MPSLTFTSFKTFKTPKRAERLTMKAYCTPWNAGLASETKAVCRRLSRLIDSLNDEINANIAEGEIVNDVWQFKTKLIEKLRAEGWTITFTNKTHVKAPKGK